MISIVFDYICIMLKLDFVQACIVQVSKHLYMYVCIHQGAFIQVQCDAVIARSIFYNYPEKAAHRSPVKVRYGVSSHWTHDAILASL